MTPKTGEGPSQAMKHLGQRYVQYVNRTYRRSDTLWEEMFRSCLVGSGDQQVVVNEMREALAAAEREIYIFTPYFIPRKAGIEFIKELRAKGTRVS